MMRLSERIRERANDVRGIDYKGDFHDEDGAKEMFNHWANEAAELEEALEYLVTVAPPIKE